MGFYNIKYLVRVLITPSCWLRNHLSNKAWDKELNYMLNNDLPFSKLDTHTVDLGDTCIWISNRYYATATTHGRHDQLPSRRTVFKFFDKLKEYSQEEEIKKDKKQLEKRMNENLKKYVSEYIHYNTLANGDKNIAFRFLIDKYPEVNKVNNFKEKVLEFVLDNKL